MLNVASVAALGKQTCHRGEMRGWGRTGPSPENDCLGGTGAARVVKGGGGGALPDSEEPTKSRGGLLHPPRQREKPPLRPLHPPTHLRMSRIDGAERGWRVEGGPNWSLKRLQR